MNTLTKTLALATIAAFIAVTGTACVTPSIPPCTTEDAQGPCYWDAATMGNGIGQSFVVTAEDEILYR